MIRHAFRILTLLVAFILLLGFHAGAKAQSAGGALANGNVWNEGHALSIQANQSKYGQIYSGYVTMMGRYNGVRFNYPSVYVADPTWTRSPDGITSVCTAYGDTLFNGQAAQVTFTWTQNENDVAKNGIAWQFVAYNLGDLPGSPMGAVLNASPAVTTVDGRVIVNLPGAPVEPAPDKATGKKG